MVSTQIIDDLEREMCAHILENLPADSTGNLAAQPLPGLLIEYGNWKARLIPARPRQVHVSNEMAGSAKLVEHKANVDSVIAKIELGDDLTAHLSKGIEKIGRDRMLANLGIHHLHLSATLEPGSSFVERDEDLLFAAFTSDDAYLIGIYVHITDWARRSILETIARNWPDVGVLHRLRYAVGVENDLDDEARLALQNASISANMIEVDGSVFMTMGQTLDGTPLEVSRHRMAVMHTLNEWRANLDERLAGAARAIDETAGHPVNGAWQATVHDEQAGLVRGGVFYSVAAMTC